MIIYADVYAFLNFALDFLCLWIGGKIAGRRAEGWRLALGALFGAAYGLAILLPKGLPAWAQIPLHLLAALLMILIAFGFRDGKAFRKVSLIFLLTEAGMGGIIEACYSVGQRRVSAVGVLILAGLSTAGLAAYGLHCRRKVDTKTMKVEVSFGKHHLRCDLLVDSGNLVTEPFSALPVVILSSSVMPSEFQKPDPEHSPVPLRAIPVKTGTGLGLLYGFVPDSVTLCPPFEKQRRVDAVIGIDTECQEFGGLDGLLPASLLR